MDSTNQQEVFSANGTLIPHDTIFSALGQVAGNFSQNENSLPGQSAANASQPGQVSFPTDNAYVTYSIVMHKTNLDFVMNVV